MALIQSMSGKICMHSDVYFRTNRKTGDVSTGKLCYPSTKAPTENQIAVQNKFKAVQALVSSILAAKSTDSDLTLYNKQTSYKALYNSQSTCGNLRAFIFKREYAAYEED